MHASRHHRRPSSRGGKTTPRNISIVDEKQHQSWHTLFANAEPQAIADYINAVWLDPDFHFICERKDHARILYEP